MSRKWFNIIATVATATLICASSSCGFNQHLVSIQVTPSSVTFLSPTTDITFQLTAQGTYIHPPETKDITNQVTWQSQSADLVTVTNAGVVSTTQTGHCGVAGVTANVYTDAGNTNGPVVTGTATVTVDDTTQPVCPQ